MLVFWSQLKPKGISLTVIHVLPLSNPILPTFLFLSLWFYLSVNKNARYFIGKMKFLSNFFCRRNILFHCLFESLFENWWRKIFNFCFFGKKTVSICVEGGITVSRWKLLLKLYLTFIIESFHCLKDNENLLKLCTEFEFALVSAFRFRNAKLEK